MLPADIGAVISLRPGLTHLLGRAQEGWRREDGGRGGERPALVLIWGSGWVLLHHRLLFDLPSLKFPGLGVIAEVRHLPPAVILSLSNCLGGKRTSVLWKPAVSRRMGRQWGPCSFSRRGGSQGALEAPDWSWPHLFAWFILPNNTSCPRLLLHLFLFFNKTIPLPLSSFLGCFHWIWRKCGQTTSKGQRGMVHHWFCRASGRIGRIINFYIVHNFILIFKSYTVCTVCLKLPITT